jgi:hypothetical protein
MPKVLHSRAKRKNNKKTTSAFKILECLNFAPLDSNPGLPDGLFSNPNLNFGKILDGLEMVSVGIIYGPLVRFTAMWYILWSFSICWVHLVYFYPFWYVLQRKSGNKSTSI